MQEYLASIFNFDPKHPLIFTQFYFWAFFAIVMMGFSVIHKRIWARNAFLFAVSIFFYYKTAGLFFLLLLFSTLVDYQIGLMLDRSNKEQLRKILLGISICVNLGTLIFFKYAYFFTDAYNEVFDTNSTVFNFLAQWTNDATGFLSTQSGNPDVATHFRIDEILLPVGVSFFTFQTISYSIDVYRREIKAVRNIFDFGFYVSYFPQLVAGPIVRASDFVPQIYTRYQVTRFEFGMALFWILNGLLKKMVLGDYISVNFIDRVFDNPSYYTGFEVLSALFGYSLQVYADFSGYTDIAIGVSLLLGFRLAQNFNSPYKARNVADFWRRWHMSLSSWLKDYLYIPLGGNRKATLGTFLWTTVILLFVVLMAGSVTISESPIPVYWIVFGAVIALVILALIVPSVKRSLTTNVNLMLTMTIGGLWHGASWNFVIWGALNGLGLIVYKEWRKISPYEKLNYWPVTAFKVLLTFTFISFTRLFFRAGDIKNTGNGMETAGNLWNRLWYHWDWEIIPNILTGYWEVFAFIGAGLIIHWLPETFKIRYRKAFAGAPIYAQAVISIVVVFVIYQSITSELQPFIYFQF